MSSRGRTGLVVAGAGARGAYEAGALRVLLPQMAAAGAVPTVLVGTSAGALNVVGLAGGLDAGVPAATDALVRLWSDVRLGDVVDVSGTLAGGLGYVAQLAGLPVRLASLLDTRPQRATLAEVLPLEQLHANVRSGPVDAVAVATTRVDTGGTVVFVEKKPSVPLPPPDPGRGVTYVETTLTVDHVLASCAVPVAFRPVLVTTPERERGWYVDGGLRLNTPLKPALDLGCDALGVVATQPATAPVLPPDGARSRPDVPAVAALALRALLADRMVEDLQTLVAVNRLVAAAGSAPARSTGEAYREVTYRFAGPPADRAGELARLALEVYRREYSGLRALRDPPLAVLERLIGGAADDRGELLSFLFFDRAFTRAAAELGAEHARSTLSA